ncbi:hypothetical protein [Vibrio sp. K4]|uniref:hypothetical protein n=1 Tax=Vibrio sp. K4 TaxID=3391579 RepID=UPI003DA6FD05
MFTNFFVRKVEPFLAVVLVEPDFKRSQIDVLGDALEYQRDSFRALASTLTF